MARVNVNFNGREITGPFWGLHQSLMKDLVGKKNVYINYMDGLRAADVYQE